MITEPNQEEEDEENDCNITYNSIDSVLSIDLSASQLSSPSRNHESSLSVQRAHN